MKMGTAQKQNIAIQYRYFKKHGIRQAQRPNPMSFKEWLLRGMEHYKQQGFTFQLLTPSLMRINRPGQNSILRTCENFREEYEKEYLSKFNSFISLPKVLCCALLMNRSEVSIWQKKSEDKGR